MKNIFYKIDLGVRYMILASALFAFMAYFVKELSYNMSSVEITFFRNILGIFIVLFSLWKYPPKQDGGKLLLLIFRGAIGASGLLLYFYNIVYMPIADALTFAKTSPLFTALLAYFVLKEEIGKKGWIAIFIGFIGILFVVKPTGDFPLKLALTGVLSGVFAAMAYTSIRELKKHYDGRVIVLSFVVTGTLIPLLAMVLGEFYTNDSFDFIIAKFVMPQKIEWLYIICMGILATGSQLYMTKAYSLTQAGIAGAASYTNIFFGIIVGLFLGEAFPGFFTSIGIMLIVLAGIMVSFSGYKG